MLGWTYTPGRRGAVREDLSKVREALKNVDAEDVKAMESNRVEVREIRNTAVHGTRLVLHSGLVTLGTPLI